MTTLLLLGSKPDPVLPPVDAFHAIACANASGRSARSLDLPDPVFTVISAIVTSGKKPANDLAVANLAGLRTRDLYFLPRPPPASPLRRALFPLRLWRCQPWYFRRRLEDAGYAWDRFVDPGYHWYLDRLHELTSEDPHVAEAVVRKQPSTGAFAVITALALGAWDRVILAGFSFELTHAYAENPTISQLGTTRSKHADTDITVMRALAHHRPGLLTTESVVAQATGIDYL